jgi:hypothetical protein
MLLIIFGIPIELLKFVVSTIRDDFQEVFTNFTQLGIGINLLKVEKEYLPLLLTPSRNPLEILQLPKFTGVQILSEDTSDFLKKGRLHKGSLSSPAILPRQKACHTPRKIGRRIGTFAVRWI